MTRDSKSAVAFPVHIGLPTSDRLGLENKPSAPAGRGHPQRTIRAHGTARSYDVATLLEQMRVPGVIAPSEASIRVWAEAEELDARKKWDADPLLIVAAQVPP